MSTNRTVALILDDAAEISARLEETGFTVLFSTADGNEGLRLAELHKPDIVILDLILGSIDGITFLEKLSALRIGTVPVVYSAYGSDEIIRCATRRGAALYLVKPTPAEVIAEKIMSLGKKETDAETMQDNMAELRISNVFLAAGIPPHIKGYGFLRYGVKLAMRDPSMLGNITKQLYPSIADEFETSPSKVERAIRHAIEVAWNRGRIENLNSVFGVSFYMSGDKPTNGEFIALVADRILQEQRMGKFN